ncbi:hypothetical protein Taro_036877 [Colocasia esculenta]|uniref:Uncharacterized protein n=1 Tax=Colocasia esculenta TaxID=4460 RepID=A0A843W9K7_COLES|nr:hypothetical protein [Colocasia esculenta]
MRTISYLNGSIIHPQSSPVAAVTVASSPTAQSDASLAEGSFNHRNLGNLKSGSYKDALQGSSKGKKVIEPCSGLLN